MKENKIIQNVLRRKSLQENCFISKQRKKKRKKKTIKKNKYEENTNIKIIKIQTIKVQKYTLKY